jgi:hypothetical protein
MSVRNCISAAAALVLFLTTGACIIAVVDYPGDREFPSETTTNVYEFQEGGDLILENMDGDIFIEGWDRDEVELVLEKFFNPRSGRLGIYGRRDFVPEVDVEETEGLLRIRTRSREMEMGSVNFIMKVPHSINLRRIISREGYISVSGIYGKSVLEVIKGDVAVENYSGSLSVFVEEGSIEAELLDLRDSDDINLSAGRGDITIRLLEEVKAFVEASVSGGEIVSDFEYEKQEPFDRAAFQIGEGGPGIRLSTLDGSVFIHRPPGEISRQEK